MVSYHFLILYLGIRVKELYILKLNHKNIIQNEDLTMHLFLQVQQRQLI